MCLSMRQLTVLCGFKEIMDNLRRRGCADQPKNCHRPCLCIAADDATTPEAESAVSLGASRGGEPVTFRTRRAQTPPKPKRSASLSQGRGPDAHILCLTRQSCRPACLGRLANLFCSVAPEGVRFAGAGKGQGWSAESAAMWLPGAPTAQSEHEGSHWLGCGRSAVVGVGRVGLDLVEGGGASTPLCIYGTMVSIKFRSCARH